MALAVVGVVALAVRVAVVLVAQRHLELGFSDNYYYHWAGRALAEGHGFVNPFLWQRDGVFEPTAGWPPAYPAYLGAVSALGFTSVLAHRLASALLGAVGAVLLGLVGWRVAGPRAGLVAAGITAVYPTLYVNDGMLLNESLYVPVLGLVLLASYAVWAQPTWVRAGLLGAAVGLAALTRAEALALLAFLVVPLYVVVRGVPAPRRLALGAVSVAATLVVVAPWVAYNNARFSEPVLITNGAGFVLAIANCDATYEGRFLGYWNIDCALEDWPDGDESVAERAARQQGLDHLRDNLGRVPVVVAARVGRLYEVFRPAQNIEFNTFFERRGLWPSRVGLAMYYAVLPLAAVGAVTLWRRRVTVVPLVALIATATLAASASFGITRYRVPADVAFLVLAGVGVDALWRWWRDRPRHDEASVPAPDATAAPVLTGAPEPPP